MNKQKHELDESPLETLTKTDGSFYGCMGKEGVVPYYVDDDYCLVREINLSA